MKNGEIKNNFMKEIITGYKAFRLNKDNKLCYLFKTHNGSSTVELDTWLKTKWVSESNGKKYRSGFHFLRDNNSIEAFNKLTKGKYVFIPVQCRSVEAKPRSRSNSWLAVEIFISSYTANNAITSFLLQ